MKLTRINNKSFKFKLFFPMAILLFVLLLVIAVTVLTLFQQYAITQVSDKKLQYEEQILNILSQPYNQIVKPDNLFILKVKSTAKIEIYSKTRMSKLDIVVDNNVFYQIDETNKYLNNSVLKESRLLNLLVKIFPINYQGEIYFKPWDWKITFTIDNTTHYLFMQKAMNLLLGIVFLLTIATVILVLFMSHITIKPLNQIINSIQQGKEPTYHGINEFEFLSDSIASYIHKRIISDQKLQSAIKVAEDANNAKSEFLSSMSHELRTPMNAILGFSQLLDMNAENNLIDTQQKNVKEIMSAGNHLLNLINEVLDLAKIEEGKIEILIEEVFVDEIMQQCLSLIKPSMEERQIQLHNHISHIPNKVLADSIRLKQVLLNILSNAVKYNSYNGSITLHQEIIDNQHLRISIMDSGEGLTDEDISKLFIPFERLNKNTNIEGTGIGLVLSKNLMELMNGTIGIESTVGKGSTFWVKLQLSDTIA